MDLSGKAMAIVGGILGLVIVIVLVAALYPTLVEAGGDLQTSGMPQADKFGSGGVLWTIFGIIIFVSAIIAVVAFVKHK